MWSSTLLLATFGMPLTVGAVLDAMSQAETKPSAISVLLRASHDTVRIGEPITLKETITNRSDHEVTFGRDRYHPGCPVDVVDEKGTSAADKKVGYRRGHFDVEEAVRSMTPTQVAESGLLIGSLVWIALKPGESFVESCDVSGFYDMTKPGVYNITAPFHDPESANTVTSKAIHVTVLK